MTWTLPFLTMTLCVVAGIGIGAVYFGGLWLTLSKMQERKHFYRFLFASWGVRTAFLLGTFFLVMQGDWQRLLSAFAGFLFVRYAASGYVRRLSAGKESADGKL